MEKLSLKPNFSLQTIPRFRFWAGLICGILLGLLIHLFLIYILIFLQYKSRLHGSEYLIWTMQDSTIYIINFFSALFSLLIANFFMYQFWLKRPAPQKKRAVLFKRITDTSSDSIWTAAFYGVKLFFLVGFGFIAFGMYLISFEASNYIMASLILMALHLFLRENQGLSAYYKISWRFWLSKLLFYLSFSLLFGLSTSHLLIDATKAIESQWVENKFGFERMTSSLAEDNRHYKSHYQQHIYFFEENNEVKVYWQNELYPLSHETFKKVRSDLYAQSPSAFYNLYNGRLLKFNLDKNLSAKDFNAILAIFNNYFDGRTLSIYSMPSDLEDDFRAYVEYNFDFRFSDCNLEKIEDDFPKPPPPPPSFCDYLENSHYLHINQDKTYTLNNQVLSTDSFYYKINTIVEAKDPLIFTYDDEIKVQTIIDVYSYVLEIYLAKRETHKEVLQQNPYYTLPENDRELRDTLHKLAPIRFVVSK